MGKKTILSSQDNFVFPKNFEYFQDTSSFHDLPRGIKKIADEVYVRSRNKLVRRWGGRKAEGREVGEKWWK